MNCTTFAHKISPHRNKRVAVRTVIAIIIIFRYAWRISVTDVDVYFCSVHDVLQVGDVRALVTSYSQWRNWPSRSEVISIQAATPTILAEDLSEFTVQCFHASFVIVA